MICGWLAKLSGSGASCQGSSQDVGFVWGPEMGFGA